MICTVSKRNFGDIVKPCRFGLAVSMVVTTCLPPVLNFSLHYFTRGHFSSDIDLTYSPLHAILADYRLYFLLLKLHLFDILLTEKRSACFVADTPFEVGLFTFVLVSAAGMFPPPRPALSAERPEQRRISFADSPRCHGSVDGLPRTCEWTGHPRTVPGNSPGM